MKKTYCDRCERECDGAAVQRFTIFDVNRSIDVCDKCYQEFFRWLHNKPELVEAEKNDDITKFVKESLVNSTPMDNDKMISISVNTLKKIYESYDPEGVEKFIKDIREEKNDGE